MSILDRKPFRPLTLGMMFRHSVHITAISPQSCHSANAASRGLPFSFRVPVAFFLSTLRSNHIPIRFRGPLLRPSLFGLPSCVTLADAGWVHDAMDGDCTEMQSFRQLILTDDGSGRASARRVLGQCFSLLW